MLGERERLPSWVAKKIVPKLRLLSRSRVGDLDLLPFASKQITGTRRDSRGMSISQASPQILQMSHDEVIHRYVDMYI